MIARKVSQSRIREFRRVVRAYYKKNGRILAWRQVITPYRIVVSEVMLQQTQVTRVAKKYPEFLKIFPSFQALARAPLARVLRVWQGMGYNRRGIALKRIAQQIVGTYGGQLPRDSEALVALPGIGQATAASILAFAYNQPTVFIETNIRRAFIHFFFPKKKNVTDKEIHSLVTASLDKKNPREWYWALMDYGAMLKTQPENPNRRSQHYRAQSKFEGSNRQLRGRILKILLQKKSISRAMLTKEAEQDDAAVMRVLRTLEQEGFISRRRGIYRVN